MKRKILLVLGCVMLIAATFVAWYWLRTQPLDVVDRKIDRALLANIPPRNKQVLDFIEANGKTLAPDYNDVVCTEFVITILNQFEPLSPTDKRAIRIITDDNLPTLLQRDAPIIKGVQTALVDNDKGVAIRPVDEVLPGDFVQFWNIYNGKAYGHCGVVMEIEPEKSLTVYSSHPITDGYGKQKFLWSEKTYFVRLK